MRQEPQIVIEDFASFSSQDAEDDDDLSEESKVNNQIQNPAVQMQA